MTLQEANNLFESLKTETIKESEIKIYENFVDILSKLKIKEFSTDEIQSIETELDRLSLKSNPKNRKKYFKKALAKFEQKLKGTFSLTRKGHYAGYGLGLGSSFGALLGILIGERIDEGSLGIALGVSIGMLIGILVGRRMDSQAKAEGKML